MFLLVNHNMLSFHLPMLRILLDQLLIILDEAPTSIYRYLVEKIRTIELDFSIRSFSDNDAVTFQINHMRWRCRHVSKTHS
jgi:hypothetical protein